MLRSCAHCRKSADGPLKSGFVYCKPDLKRFEFIGRDSYCWTAQRLRSDKNIKQCLFSCNVSFTDTNKHLALPIDPLAGGMTANGGLQPQHRQDFPGYTLRVQRKGAMKSKYCFLSRMPMHPYQRMQVLDDPPRPLKHPEIKRRYRAQAGAPHPNSCLATPSKVIQPAEGLYKAGKP